MGRGWRKVFPIPMERVSGMVAPPNLKRSWFGHGRTAGDRSGGSWVKTLPCIRFREYSLIRARAEADLPCIPDPLVQDMASHQRISGWGQPLAWVIGTHLIVVACSPPLGKWRALVHDSPAPGPPWGPAEGPDTWSLTPPSPAGQHQHQEPHPNTASVREAVRTNDPLCVEGRLKDNMCTPVSCKTHAAIAEGGWAWWGWKRELGRVGVQPGRVMMRRCAENQLGSLQLQPHRACK